MTALVGRTAHANAAKHNIFLVPDLSCDADVGRHGKYERAILVKEVSTELDRGLESDNPWKKEVEETSSYKDMIFETL
jgi:hypothetical protein